MNSSKEWISVILPLASSTLIASGRKDSIGVTTSLMKNSSPMPRVNCDDWRIKAIRWAWLYVVSKCWIQYLTEICVWINPYIAQESKIFNEGVEGGYFIKKSDGSVWQCDFWVCKTPGHFGAILSKIYFVASRDGIHWFHQSRRLQMVPIKAWRPHGSRRRLFQSKFKPVASHLPDFLRELIDWFWRTHSYWQHSLLWRIQCRQNA